jgi:hypothetical protein
VPGDLVDIGPGEVFLPGLVLGIDRTQKLQQAIVDRSVGRTDGAQQAEASATNDERVDT